MHGGHSAARCNGVDWRWLTGRAPNNALQPDAARLSARVCLHTVSAVKMTWAGSEPSKGSEFVT